MSIDSVPIPSTSESIFGDDSNAENQNDLTENRTEVSSSLSQYSSIHNEETAEIGNRNELVDIQSPQIQQEVNLNILGEHVSDVERSLNSSQQSYESNVLVEESLLESNFESTRNPLLNSSQESFHQQIVVEIEPNVAATTNSPLNINQQLNQTEDETTNTPNITEINRAPSNSDIVLEPVSSTSQNAVTKQSRKRELSESPSAKRMKSEDDDDSGLCPICFEQWTNSGEHRLCCLKCGHLFGRKCVMRWIKSNKQKTCPTCKEKASVSDVRNLFAKKISVVDTTDLERIKEELAVTKLEFNRLSADLARLNEINKNQKIKIDQYVTQIKQLESKCNTSTSAIVEDNPNKNRGKYIQFITEKTLELTRENNCRVMAHNSDKMLVVSVKASSALLGYGIRIVYLHDYNLGQFFPLHNRLIRDLAFHPQTGELLLSVSLDKTAKIFNVSTSRLVVTFTTDTPLWSCTWDANNPNLFYVGGQKGTVLQFNQLTPGAATETLTIPNDSSPVISLISIEPCAGSYLSQGGLLCCKLNSCWVFIWNGESFISKKILLTGPFFAVNYNKLYRQILFSTRPNQNVIHCQHIVCGLEERNDHFVPTIIHNFQGSTIQSQLTRNCQINVANDVFLACYQETKNQINVWSTTTGSLTNVLNALDSIIDITYVTKRNLFITLSEKRVKIYKVD